MKLNYKRTILVGFAFFLISAFWQAYDTIIPLILTNKFGLSQGVSGIVMALDNILALFMLPLFGILSDKTNTRLGRRTPIFSPARWWRWLHSSAFRWWMPLSFPSWIPLPPSMTPPPSPPSMNGRLTRSF